MLDDERLQLSVGGRSGRSVGVRFLVDAKDDELEGVEEIIEARPYAQLFGAGLAFIASAAGATCVVAPFLGEDLSWLLAGVFFFAWAALVFRKALHILPDRVLVYGDRIAFYRGGRKHEFRWAELAYAEHVTRKEDAHGALSLHVKQWDGDGDGASGATPPRERVVVLLATTGRYGDLGPLLEALQRHLEVRFSRAP